MTDSIQHRGPDASGHWFDTDFQVAIGHRRLSILDLTSTGNQPMVSRSGRYLIAFNGEIYNHLYLRSEIQGLLNKSPSVENSKLWLGSSDTETLLRGFDIWGIKNTVDKCIGMFAFAVWDTQTHHLTLCRDRMGEKPIYYGWQGEGHRSVFLFGSELKALKAHPSFSAPVNRDALALLARYNYIPAPFSIYRGIFKLQPGSLLTVSLDKREPEIQAYWSLKDVALLGNQFPLSGSPESMVGELEALLKSAVRQQMMADVPLGAFLSGGIDSSLVVALMQAQSDRAVKTFTIGFNEEAYNEAVHAKAVAKHLGTEHTELYVTSQQALDVIPKLPSLYCEPFADSSQIPTFLVSQLARQQVTVALSGDAGDELFAGYNRYVLANNFYTNFSKVPSCFRSLGVAGIRALSPAAWSALLEPLQSLMPRSLRQANIGDKLHKAAGVLGAKSIDELYQGLVSHWETEGLIIGGKEPKTCFQSHHALPGLEAVQRMMALDAINYLPDDILVKVDRAAMGVSLEGRAPFLDHRVVEFAWRVPQAMKMRDGVGKWILRQVLYRYVPKELIERPKMGFAVPLDTWLRGPLRDWAEALLDEGRMKREGFFNPAPIRVKWAEHLSGKRNWQYLLWNVLMFQSWLEEQ